MKKQLLKSMKGVNLCLLALLCFGSFLGTGCTWQRIPPLPGYQTRKAIPLDVGIVLENTPATQAYGPAVVKHLQDLNLFKSINFPYSGGDKVDAILKLEVAGGWRADQAGNFFRGCIVGCSLYTLSPVLGSEMTGEHDLTGTLEKDRNVVSKYSVHKKTLVSWGLMANTNEVTIRSDELQTKSLAMGLAEKLQKDWLHISPKFGY